MDKVSSLYPTIQKWSQNIQHLNSELTIFGATNCIVLIGEWNHGSDVPPIHPHPIASQSQMPINCFHLVHVPSAYMEELGFITFSAASHQGAIKMIWLRFLEAAMLSIIVCMIQTRSSYQCANNVTDHTSFNRGRKTNTADGIPRWMQVHLLFQ